MKKQTKQIAAAVVVLAAVLITGCTEQTSEMSAEEIASMMEAKQESIEDISARMVVTSSFGGETTTMRALMMAKPPDKSRFEYIEPAELAGTVKVRNGSTILTYDPAENLVTKMELREAECEPFDMDYTEVIRSLLNETDISYEGTESVNGRSAYVLNITPGDENERVHNIANTRAWVDCENWTLLEMEVYDQDGNLAVKTEYRDITFNTGIPDSEFIFEVSEDTVVVDITFATGFDTGIPVGEIIIEDSVIVERSFEDVRSQEMTLEDARANLTFDLKTPLYLPDGCEFDHAVVFGKNRVSLMYTDDAKLLCISEWASDSDNIVKIIDPEVVSINGTDGEFGAEFGFFNTLRWGVDGIEYLLSGTIAKEEMLKVAESLV